MLQGNVNFLMCLWDVLLRQLLAQHLDDNKLKDLELTSSYRHCPDLLTTIDSIPYGDIPWKAFKVKYDGELPLDPPS